MSQSPQGRARRAFRSAALLLLFGAASVRPATGQEPELPPRAGERCPGTPPPRGDTMMLGLLDLPSVFGPHHWEEGAGSVTPRPIPVRIAPEREAPLLAEISNPDDVVSREFGYEYAGAVVYGCRGPWRRVRLSGEARPAWTRGGADGRFLPLSELLVGKLNYLTHRWRGRIWPAPGSEPERPAGAELLLEAEAERTDHRGSWSFPAQVHEARLVDDELWLRVSVLEHSPCTGRDPPVVARGWIPAYDEAAGITAWFHSRGC